MRFIPAHQRSYLQSHPLAIWLSLGIAFTGCVNLILPDLSESSVALVLPPLLVMVFNLTWAAGGALSAIGLLRGKPKIEAAGMSLLASGLFSLFVSVFYVRPLAALSSAPFVVTLAIGCFLRSRHLTCHAYVNLDLPTDQPGIQEPE
jgi:hypothetical protein